MSAAKFSLILKAQSYLIRVCLNDFILPVTLSPKHGGSLRAWG